MTLATQHAIMETLWMLTGFFAVLGIILLVNDILFPEDEKGPPFP